MAEGQDTLRKAISFKGTKRAVITKLIEKINDQLADDPSKTNDLKKMLDDLAIKESELNAAQKTVRDLETDIDRYEKDNEKAEEYADSISEARYKLKIA